MLKHILPILFPSWRFFSHIAPSPRIELGFITAKLAQPKNWVAFRPLPQQLGLTKSLLHLFHSPQWNELLYINSCAEYLLDGVDEFRVQEIGRRLVNAIYRGEIAAESASYGVVFRIRVLTMQDGQRHDEIVFVSQSFVLKEASAK
jgi:hypothetical protein